MHMSQNPPSKSTVAVQRSGSMALQFTPPWFLTGAEYSRKPATFGLLINGQDAFRAVHEAIAAAQKSVCIICWGFQPSMYFIRDGKSPSIGELLEQRARAGIKVRVLSWTLDPGFLKIGSTGAAGEPNTPGRRIVAIRDQLGGTTDEQHEYNEHWFSVYDVHAPTASRIAQSFRGAYRWVTNDDSMQNLAFLGRGFSKADRDSIAKDQYMDKGVSNTTRKFLAATTSHHQKMVLIDHESADQAVGFVMGHNMLDWYWDTNEHSMKGRPHAPNKGASAPLPRQDFSSRVTGPILADLYDNFQAAWNKAVKENPGRVEGDLLAPTTSVKYQQRPRRGDVALSAQILRTQPQGGKDGQRVKDIQKMYLQAVNNATQLIYIENQYFRWPVLADRIKQHAKTLAQNGRRPEQNGSLYLFVITNTSDDGMGAGANNTQRMLESLGHGAAMPIATRDARIERGELPPSLVDQHKQKQDSVDSAQADVDRAYAERSAVDNDVRLLAGTPGSSEGITKRYENVNARIEAAEQRKARAQQELDDWTEQTISAGELSTPGLKTLVCRIVSPDTPLGKDWVETYIHAKLMIIDDTFMTLGSTNINTRSMETDSELNIIHDRPEVSKPARQTLWDLHTRNWTGGRIADLPSDDAYRAWGKIVEENRRRRQKRMSPVAPLDAFLRTDPSRKDWD